MTVDNKSWNSILFFFFQKNVDFTYEVVFFSKRDFQCSVIKHNIVLSSCYKALALTLFLICYDFELPKALMID